MNEERDLGAELSRLFADDRLSLPAAQDADERVLAGVRRRRQRRGAATAVAGVLLTGGVVAGGIAITPDDTTQADRATIHPTLSRHAGPLPASNTENKRPSSAVPPPADKPSDTVPRDPDGLPAPPDGGAPGNAPPTSTTQNPGGPMIPPDFRYGDPLGAVLGPTGVQGPSGTLNLGMSKQDALNSGLLERNAVRTVPGCSAYRMRDYAEPASSVVLVSITDNGVVSFTGSAAYNADGVHTGSSVDTVLNRYPEATVSGRTITANVAGNADADYVFLLKSESVSRISLTTDGAANCAG